MKRSTAAIVFGGSLASAALAAGLCWRLVGVSNADHTQRLPTVTIPPPAIAVLTAMNSIAERTQVQRALGDNAVAELERIVLSPMGEIDGGVVVRALRALSLFNEGHDVLAAALARPDLRTVDSGLAAVELRAAIESLAEFARPSDIPDIAVFLDFERVRDVRAAAARALGRIGDPSAVDLLRARFRKETSAQVRLEISKALQVLE